MEADMLGMAWHALTLLLEPHRLMILVLGVVIGLCFGVLPGLSGVVGLAILIPFTYNLDAYTAFALLLGMAAVITSSDFISAVLFGVPGQVGAAATVIDGHAMARRGEAGRAFGAGFASSLVGGLIGALVLAVSIPVVRPVLLAVGSPELLAFTLLGLSTVATLSGKAPLKGLTAAGIGLMIAMIGSHAQGGTLRWTFNTHYLWEGMPLVPATLGLFALPEIAELAIMRRRIAGDNAPKVAMSDQWEGVRDVYRNWWLVIRCSVLGTLLGAIPGIGTAVIDWIAYGYAQRSEKNPELFGTGDVRGVIAPESSNNAKEGGHLLPTIAFGVPSGASMALLLGAFLIQGMTPGPEMLTKHLDVTYTIVWSLTLAHVIGAIICLLGSRWLAAISRIRPEILLPGVLTLVFIAAYQGSQAWGDIVSVLVFGLLGWLMKIYGWPRPPLILGLAIGAIFERYFFISTQLYSTSWMLRPAVLCIAVVVAWVLYRPIVQIVSQLIEDMKAVRLRNVRLHTPVVFTIAVLAVCVAAAISARSWPAEAKLVPLTACGITIVAGLFNLVTEVFGASARVGDTVVGTVPAAPVGAVNDPSLFGLPTSVLRGRATVFFGWLIAFAAAIATIGFIPAIAVFVFFYMRLQFKEGYVTAMSCAAVMTIGCWLVFQIALQVTWPQSLIGDVFPVAREFLGVI
jgi:putative tricarboxylic transport membrane protein